jgi:hypothetical protein
MDLFLGSLFYSVSLYVYFYDSTMLFWLLQICSVFRSETLWYLQLCSFCSRLFWLFGVFCDSIWILELFFLVLWRMSLEFWVNCLEFVDFFFLGNNATFIIPILPIHEHEWSFYLLVSFSNFFFSVL